MSMRKTPQEIRKGIEDGFTEEPWEDLMEDFNYSGSEEKDAALAVQCTVFLERVFPGEKFGWQDFDKLLSEKFFDRYPSAVAAATQVTGEEVEDIEDEERRGKEQARLDAMSDDELVSAFTQRPGVYLMDATDEPGTVLMFMKVHSLSDVRR
jgi:hypothetical protein